MTNRSNCDLIKRIDRKKDFRVDYTDPMKETNLEKSFPGNTFLKDYELRAEQELLEEEITVSKVIQFTNKLEDVGMYLCLAEEIRRIKSSEKDKLLELYREAFSEFDKNDAMLSWVNNCKRMGLFRFNELIAGVSFKRFEIDMQTTCYQVLLIGVFKEYKGQHYGSKLMRNIMEQTKRIVLWADLQSVKFYEKLGFKEDKVI